MEKNDFLNLFVRELDIPRSKASYLFDIMINEMQISLKNWDKVKISNIGTITKKEMSPRKVISNLWKKPKKITTKSKIKVKFNPSVNLELILNS